MVHINSDHKPVKFSHIQKTGELKPTPNQRTLKDTLVMLKKDYGISIRIGNLDTWKESVSLLTILNKIGRDGNITEIENLLTAIKTWIDGNAEVNLGEPTLQLEDLLAFEKEGIRIDSNLKEIVQISNILLEIKELSELGTPVVLGQDTVNEVFNLTPEGRINFFKEIIQICGKHKKDLQFVLEGIKNNFTRTDRTYSIGTLFA